MMKGDFSRRTFDRKKHYSNVLMQQGRVQLDSDWNEQQAIHKYRHETQTGDVIGRCGAPKPEHDSGFKIGVIPGGLDLSISRGRIYVDGILCENDSDDVTLKKQNDLPMEVEDLAERYLVYLDVWQRHITAIDDPDIREKALGGPDTATRTKTVWQVKLHPVESSAECNTLGSAWKPDATGSGKLSAHTVSTGTDTGPCALPPTAGFSRLENQLYRVEIHRGTDLNDPTTFKWSRDNGSVVTSITNVNDQILTVKDTGRDEVLGFASDQWVEILDDRMELVDQRGHIVQIDTVNHATREITIRTPTLPVIDKTRHPKLRRWDQSGATATAEGVEITTDWMPLEDGIEVQFSGDTYRSGDYWLIPARTAISTETGSLEWEGVQPPHGIHHHYCPLALVDFDDNKFSLNSDCRHLFPPLTDITASDVRFDNDTCQLPNTETVQDAIDTLCNRKEDEPGIHIDEVLKGVVDEALGNYTEVAVAELAEGLRIVCDGGVDNYTVEGKPTCYVTLYMPYPLNSADRELWGNQVLGFQPLILAADVKSDGAVIYWNPADATGSWLEKSRLLEVMEEMGYGDRVLASLTLKGNFIWAEEDHSLYLDGEAFGVEDDPAKSNLHLPSGNGRRGGDFEMWFWLVRETGTVRYIEYNVSKEEKLIVVHGLCADGTKNCEEQNGNSGGRYYAKVGARVAVNGNPRILSELILEQTDDDRQTLATGETWVLGGGYSLVARQIDLEGNKVWLELYRYGAELDKAVVESGGVYTRVAERIAGETDVPMFVTYVDTIFRGTESNIVQLCYTWLISDDVETIE